MDPRNGEILAMAAWPTLDPNHYEPWLVKAEEDETAITPAVAAQYEPGSTFKVLTMAAALERRSRPAGRHLRRHRKSSKSAGSHDPQLGLRRVGPADDDRLHAATRSTSAWPTSPREAHRLALLLLPDRIRRRPAHRDRPGRRSRRAAADAAPSGVDRVRPGDERLRAGRLGHADSADHRRRRRRQWRRDGAAARRARDRQRRGRPTGPSRSCSGGRSQPRRPRP